MGMQSSPICIISFTHLTLHETSFGALWPILVPYLNVGTRTGQDQAYPHYVNQFVHCHSDHPQKKNGLLFE